MILAGDLASARELIDSGLALAERQALRVPRQWLYSTRGELALAQWAEAETWFVRGLAEAQLHHNQSQVANYHGNLGRVALARGEREQALQQLEQARSLAQSLAPRHLQAQITQWLAEAQATM